MEFARIKQFVHEDFKQKHSASKYIKQSLVQITCMHFDMEDQIISCGLSNGQVMQFVKKGFDTKYITERKKDYEIEFFQNIKGQHKGEIKCLIYEQIFNSKYIITGSVDRTIKLWDTDKKKKAVIQTIVGHNGTILALGYVKSLDTLVSVSTDKTFKIWKQEEDRQMLYHPWFVQFQIISDFSMKKVLNSTVYMTEIHIRGENCENLQIYTGDTEGTIHMVKPESVKDSNKNKKDALFELKTQPNCHRLNVIQILYVAKDNEMFSIGYDQRLLGFQESQRKIFIDFKNPYKCLFTAMTWNPDNQELIVGDDSGRLYFINVHTDKSHQEFKLYEERVISLTYMTEGEKNIIIVGTKHFIDVLKIKRGVKAGNLQDQHTGAILDLYGLIPYKLTKGYYKEPPTLISASLDHSIRIWDPKDMTCQNVMVNPDKDEISSLHYLEESNLFATGHGSGKIRLWNIELNNSLTLDQKGQFQHMDTVTCFTSFLFKPEKKGLQQEEKNEFLISSGFDSKINFWEIFEKKSSQGSVTNSSICPQLKHSLYAIPVGQDEPEERGDEILCMAVNNINDMLKHVLAAGNRGLIYVISNDDYEQVQCLNRHQDSINCMVVEEKILFSGSDDFHICLWDLHSYTHLSSIKAHTKPVRNMLMIQETGHLISCAYDGKIKIWDYTSRVCIQEFEKKNEGIRCLSYVLDEKEVEEEVEDENGDYDTIKKMKTDLKLFVGTDENNIHCFQLEQFLQDKIENIDFKQMKIEYELHEKELMKEKQTKEQEEDLYSDEDQEHQKNNKFMSKFGGLKKQASNSNKLTDKNINSILENQNKFLEEFNK